MKFGARYEILRALTRGEVETFAVRDRATGEKALANIFECPEPPVDQPTVQWILTSFTQLAAETPGIVIDAGRYDIASFAYIVSRWPTDEAIDDWVRQYQDKIGKPKPSVAAESSPASSADGSQAASPDLTSEPPKAVDDSVLEKAKSPVTAREPGEFTRQFFGGVAFTGESVFRDGQGSTGERGNLLEDQTIAPAESRSTPDVHELAGEASEPFARSAPEGALPGQGEFTQQFFREINVPPDNSSGPATGVSNPIDPTPLSKESPPPGETAMGVSDKHWLKDSKPGQFTNQFMQDFGSGMPPAGRDETPLQEPPKPASGEFTKLFGMPLTSEGDKSTTYDGRASESKSGTGEFTRMFGPYVPDAPGEVHSHTMGDEPEATSTRGSTTDLFGADHITDRPSGEGSYAAGTRTPVGNLDDGGATQVFAGRSEYPEYPEAVPSREPLTSPALSKEPIPDSSQFNAVDGGATVVFRAPAEVSTRGEPEQPTGPSDYTMFMNREALSSLVSESAGAPPASGASKVGSPAAAPASPFITPPVVTPPAMPSYQAPQPPAYQAPAAPGVTPPAIPSFTPPAVAAPQLAPAPQPSAAPKSYWPLIIVLNVLFILAVLLILYFALKH